MRGQNRKCFTRRGQRVSIGACNFTRLEEAQMLDPRENASARTLCLRY